MSNSSMTSAQIFVVDSSPSNLVLVLSILRRAGFTNALPFTDAQTALDAVEHVHPDLVLLDLDMPDCDVVAFTDALRTSGPASDFVPVMALSGDSTGETLKNALDAGVSDCASKPVKEGELLLRVHNLLLIRFRQEELEGRGSAPVAEAQPTDRSGHQETGTRDETDAVRAVIERGGPDIVFQPIVELTTGKTVGVEALARFGPDAPPPDRWFAYAATVGLELELELAAIGAALRHLDRIDPTLRMAVNLSPATFFEDRFHVLVGDTDPRRLAFELSERRAVADYDTLRDAMAHLRAAGALVCVDNARADYESFRHILDLRPDVMKLDIALTRDVDTDPVKRMLATSLEKIAGEIGATITAVGIETQAELDALRDLGIDNGQGFHIARPAALEREVAPADMENRAALLEAISVMLARGRRVAAFSIDLDNFKEVNDTFGRDVGDEVLRTVNARLQGTLRPGHIVAPVGGDAFVVISDTVADELEALSLAYRIRDVLARRVGFAAIQVEVSASVGIAFASDASPANLLADAEGALDIAKRSGRGGVELKAHRSTETPGPRCPA